MVKDNLLIAADAIQQHVYWLGPRDPRHKLKHELQAIVSRLLEISHKESNALRDHLAEIADSSRSVSAP